MAAVHDYQGAERAQMVAPVALAAGTWLLVTLLDGRSRCDAADEKAVTSLSSAGALRDFRLCPGSTHQSLATRLDRSRESSRAPSDLLGAVPAHGHRARLPSCRHSWLPLRRAA